MPFLSFAAGIIAVFIWSVIPAFVKLSSDHQSLSFVLVIRFLLAAALFLPFYRKIISKMRMIQAKYWFLLSVILGANFYFQGLAMKDLPASWYLILFSLNPILALMFVGIKMNSKIMFGLALALIGSLAFVNVSDFSGSMQWISFFYLIIGMLTWVAYTVLVKKFQVVYSDVETTGLTQLVSLLSVSLIWCFQGAQVFPLTETQWLSASLLGISTALAYFFFSYCLRRTPVFGIVSQYLEPVFGVIVGVLVFRETLSPLQVIGACGIICGAVRIERSL